MKPFFSIITATYNSSLVIEGCIDSLLEQKFRNYEHIIVDGKSCDSTIQIIEKKKNDNEEYGRCLTVLSEKDSGIYEAFNKGLDLASGKYLFFLGSDDFLYDKNTLLGVYNSLIERENIFISYGDILILDRQFIDVKRFWRSTDYVEYSFWRGWMPPFSGMFISSHIVKSGGLTFDVSYKVAGDLKFIGEVLSNVDSSQICRLDLNIVKMRSGGASLNGVSSFFTKLIEDFRVYRELGLGNFAVIQALVMKRFRKIKQLRRF